MITHSIGRVNFQKQTTIYLVYTNGIHEFGVLTAHWDSAHCSGTDAQIFGLRNNRSSVRNKFSCGFRFNQQAFLPSKNIKLFKC